jgi:hypothetical protein
MLQLAVTANHAELVSLFAVQIAFCAAVCPLEAASRLLNNKHNALSKQCICIMNDKHQRTTCGQSALQRCTKVL